MLILARCDKARKVGDPSIEVPLGGLRDVSAPNESQVI